MIDRPTDQLPQAFFLPTPGGQCFCLFHAAVSGRPLGRVLYLHPFAEEMNASRRVVAQQCRALAADGFAVLQIDLLGCGDSSGDFDDATWQAWLDDVQRALRWIDEHLPAPTSGPLWLWGLRAGALLACASAGHRLQTMPADPAHLLLWQPAASGRQQLQQFMRLHAAAQWLGGAGTGEAPPLALAAGRPAQVAGYNLSPALANGLEDATLDLPPCTTGRVVWVELANAPPTGGLPASPAAERQASAWRKAGWHVDVQTLASDPFWQNVAESELGDALCSATRAALNTPARPNAPTPA